MSLALSIPAGLDQLDVTALARHSAERTLLARLHYTRVQRGLASLGILSDRGLVVPWFAYTVCGVRFGLHEGIVLGEDGDFRPAWAERVAAQTGATLLKLTRVAPGPVRTGAVDIDRFRGWTMVRRGTRAREVWPLAASYEETLSALGRHTRRNIRAARKFAAGERLGFETAARGELISAAERAELVRKTSPGTRMSLTARLEAHADQTGRPFRTVVRTADGTVVSYACGYFGEPSAAYLLYQLNDPALNAIGPSLLHRAFLMEWFTTLGCTEFVFVHGCSGILHHACVRQPLEEIWLMRRSVPGYVSAAVLGLVKPNASIGRLARLSLLGGGEAEDCPKI